MGALSPTLDARFFALSGPEWRDILDRLGRGAATLSQLAGTPGLTLDGIEKHVGILAPCSKARAASTGSTATARRAGSSTPVASCASVAPGKVHVCAAGRSDLDDGGPVGIDEYRLLVQPLVLGRGQALFDQLPASRHLDLVESKPFPSGIVLQIYRPKHP